MANLKKAVVISNCQCLPLASALTTFSADTTFDFFGVHVISAEKRIDEIDRFLERANLEYDFALCIPLSHDFGAIAKSEIEKSFRKPVVSISNIHFSGLHPDLCYIGGLSQRVAGPLGDYHSKICLYGFLSGFDIEKTSMLFREKTFEAAGYYSEYDKSLDEMKNRDIDVDVPISRIIPELVKTKYCFYSVNHPTSSLFVAYTRLILSFLEDRGLGGVTSLPFDANLCTDTLANNVIFPIYPEIARYHGVSEFGSYRFKPTGSRINSISLRTFVEKEFAALAAVGINSLAGSHTGKQIMKNMENL